MGTSKPRSPGTARESTRELATMVTEFPTVKFTTVLAKSSLTKTWVLNDDGKVEKKGTPNFSSGIALVREEPLNGVTGGDLRDIAANIYGLPAYEPRPDGRWNVVTRNVYAANPALGSVPRTKDDGFKFANDPGVILIDSDPRPDAEPPIPALDGHELMAIIESIMPSASSAAYWAVPSASAGICLESTGEPIHDKGGLHLYLAAKEPTDISRF